MQDPLMSIRIHDWRCATAMASILSLWVACSEGSSGTSVGSGGAGGATATGGAHAVGGAAGGSGGASTVSEGGRGGGTASTGGTTTTGGALSSGGRTSAGGATASGGSTSSGGTGGTAGAADAGRDSASDSNSADARPDSGDGCSGTGGIGTGGRTGSGGATGPALDGGTGLPAITIWIAGDSTVKTYAAGNTDGNNGAELEGWGQELGQFFSSKVTINNQAMGGRSVAMFMGATESTCKDSTGTPAFQLDSSGNKIDSSFWANIKKGIKPGDFLLAQFGHNDETDTCPRHVSTTDFETYLGFMADTVIAKGATPIFVTPMGHRTFSGTKFNNTLLPYANAMKDEASKKKLEVEDLNLRSGEYCESVGNSYLASKIFDGGTTHFIKAGAIKMAELIAGEIKKNGGPLAAYLK
jgi:lysophospholipase L1-like esterase